MSSSVTPTCHERSLLKPPSGQCRRFEVCKPLRFDGLLVRPFGGRIAGKFALPLNAVLNDFTDVFFLCS